MAASWIATLSASIHTSQHRYGQQEYLFIPVTIERGASLFSMIVLLVIFLYSSYTQRTLIRNQSWTRGVTDEGWFGAAPS